MGKKSTSSITENEGSGKTKAIWNDGLVAIFCEICVKEVAKGNRPGTHFDKIRWVNVVNVFKEITGRDYDKKQLKNKWDSLKTDWKLWSSLMHKETGIGWDPAKKTVDAPPEWWQSKIKMNVEYRKFRDVGISHDMMDMYDKMFKGSTTGEKRTNDESDISRGLLGGLKWKKGKLGGAAKLSKQIDHLVEVVDSRSTSTSMHRSSQGTSIAEVMEAVATLPGQGIGDRNAQECFQRFGETVSRYFDVMLDILYEMVKVIIKPLDPEFRSTLPEILSDSRYIPHFKVCIIFNALKFGKYYLMDAGYPQMKGFLGPYKGKRYRLPHFRRGEEPTGHKEIFNHVHSSLRSIIERTFGVWKIKWSILCDMPSYSYEKQVKIIIATMALHNYIRSYAQRDRDFDESENYSSEEVNEEMEVNTHAEDGSGRREMEM
ncbi:hypothetical protein Dsin_021604 [Dipteronia sinensis]|uniref:Myb/SANT-like domain-containing protein n=1 Tax=Dipteronia sinensis TaxID=43782 RepID=A0AAE0DZ93_9ROSI|nr:hypothetical protein Dsin_021604 [Dipteronia sinensis]